MGDLSKNFSTFEFRCPCPRCAETKPEVNPRLVTTLQELRDTLVMPVHITSGYRCPAHNVEVGGADYSAHVMGMAADLLTRNSGERFEILQIVMRLFGRVGVYPGHIHVDVDNTKTGRVCWYGGN